MSSHQISAFKTSCLKLPINPSNKLPIPAFEHSFQLPSDRPQSHNSIKGKKLRPRKSVLSNHSDNMHIKLTSPNVSAKKLNNEVSNNVNNLYSPVNYQFSDFLESIPDYSDVNDLPTKEFYDKINNLKLKQRRMFYDIEHQFSDGDQKWLNTYQSIGFDSTKDSRNNKKLKKKLNNKEFETNSDCEVISNESRDYKKLSKSPTKCVRIDNSSIRNTPESEISTVDTCENKNDFYIKRSKHSSLKSIRKRNSISSPFIDFDDDIVHRRNSDSDECLNNSRSKSAPNSPLKSRGRVSPRKNSITIPKPFKMTVRDEEDKIVNDLMSSIDEEEPKIDSDKSNLFRAHPVPIESRILLFDQINEDRERRREIAKLNRKIALQSQIRPFSFTRREEEIREISKLLSKSSPELDTPVCGKDHSTVHPKKFKAKPIPKNLFSNYFYQKMREDEYYRAMKKRIRAEELLKASSFPPSMAARDEFERNLDDMTTTPESRQLSRSPKSSKKARKQKALCYRRHLDSQVCFTPSTIDLHPTNVSNLAALLRIEASRKRLELEMQQKLEEQRRKQETRWRAKLIHKNEAWKTLQYDHEEELAMRLQLRKEEEQLREEQFRHQMELMLDRVQQMPYLFERS